MSITEQKPNINQLPNAPHSATKLIQNWLNSAMQKWRRRKMIAMYETLDDRILWDIGISRGEIEDMVDNLAVQKSCETTSAKRLASKQTTEDRN
jgi:uncharacterized protein YjiS (DUF1127 family)